MTKKNGKIALITGANKGLGKEIGRQLGALGAAVIDSLRRLAAPATSWPGRARAR